MFSSPAIKNHIRIPRRAGRSQHVFLILVAFRIFNALTLRTFFQPDEYYQSLEPAWQLAFGPDSGAWLTWEWKNQLRSSLHPLLFACVYHTAAVIAAASNSSAATRTALLLAAPRIAQALFAACLDYYTWSLAQQVYGTESKCAQISLALAVLNPWSWFCSTRTLSNCLEATLTSAALSYWPWSWTVGPQDGKAASEPRSQPRESEFIPVRRFGKAGQLSLSYLLAAIACVLRPTNVLIWIPIGLLSLWHTTTRRRQAIVMEAIFYGTAVAVISILADRWYYGMWTFPPLNFVHFNLSQNLAVFYGHNRWDYYLTEGLPLLLTTITPFAATAVFKALFDPLETGDVDTKVRRNALRSLALTAIFSVSFLSLISHKEVRFVYPLLPVLHVVAAAQVARFIQPSSKPKRVAVLVLILLNILIALYASQIHQRGVIDVIDYLRQQHELRLEQDPSSHTAVGFLMPCHSTPWRSHLVYPGIDAWALTCEPPLDVPSDRRSSYLDEADQFYLNPEAWLESEMRQPGLDAWGDTKEKREWPEYVVFFQQLEPVVRRVLQNTTYNECWRGFNSHWHDDWRRHGDVVAWCCM